MTQEGSGIASGTPSGPAPAASHGLPASPGWRKFWIGLGALTLVFSPWLVAWIRFAASDELASYTLLIPVVSIWMMAQARKQAPMPGEPAMVPGVLLALAAAALAGAAFWIARGPEQARPDHLAPAVLAFLGGVLACFHLTLGRAVVRHHAFPLLFLIFATPVPSWAVNGLEIFFQHTSAEVADWMMKVARIPTLRSGLQFQLPGITIRVAQECSGIRSSMVLFIVSIYAGHVILRTRSRRLVLALFVIPLGILRNGFRIVTIAALCTHVSPRMIDSPIHHRGGPIFFALSLIPLFFFLVWLRRRERSAEKIGTDSPAPKPGASPGS